MSKAGPVLDDPRYLELKDRFAGLVVLLGAMVFCIGLSLWAKGVARPVAQVMANSDLTRGVVGWPHSVDAMATLDAAKRSSRARELRRIILEGVKSDGTLDPTTGPGSATYLFHNGVKKPKVNGAPVPEKAITKGSLCPRQVVRVGRDGLDPQAELKEYRCPEVISEPLHAPKCTPRELWARAVKKGASVRHMAHMEYYRAKAGPAWRMEIPAERFRLIVSDDCQRELDAREATVIPN